MSWRTRNNRIGQTEKTGEKPAGTGNERAADRLDYLRSCADIRRSGSAAIDLAYLACGRHDVFFDMRLKPWDYAAGSLIVQEAGGLVQMPLIGEMDYRRSTAILAASPACMEPAAEVFRRNNRAVNCNTGSICLKARFQRFDKTFHPW